MHITSSVVLRITLGITFLWIAFLIWQAPGFWSGYLPPIAMSSTGLSASQLILGAAVLDAAIGILLLFNIKTHWVALVAALHLFGILIFSGIDDLTVRDIGLLGAALALLVETMPASWKKRVS